MSFTIADFPVDSIVSRDDRLFYPAHGKTDAASYRLIVGPIVEHSPARPEIPARPKSPGVRAKKAVPAKPASFKVMIDADENCRNYYPEKVRTLEQLQAMAD